MPLSVYCRNCQRTYSVSDSAAGTSIRCPGGHVLFVTANPTPSPPAPVAPQPRVVPQPLPPKSPLPPPPPRRLPNPALQVNVPANSTLESRVWRFRVAVVVPVLLLGCGAIGSWWYLNTPRVPQEDPASDIKVVEGPKPPEVEPPKPEVPPVEVPGGETPGGKPGEEKPPRKPEPALPDSLLRELDRLRIPLPPAKPSDPPRVPVWMGHTAHLRGLAYSDDGRFVLSVSGDHWAIAGKSDPDNSIRAWDARTGRVLHQVDGFQEPVDALSLSQGGRYAVFAAGARWVASGQIVRSKDHDLRLYDIQEKREIGLEEALNGPPSSSPPVRGRYRGLDGQVSVSCFSPDRRHLLGGSYTGDLILWDVETAKIIHQARIRPVREDRSPTPNVAKFDPSGRAFLTADEGNIRIWDVEKMREVGVLAGHKDFVWCLAVTRTPAGRTLVLSGGGHHCSDRGGGEKPGFRDYAIRLWDLENRIPIRSFSGHQDTVWDLAFCPDGKRFVSVGWDGTVRLWDVASGRHRILGRHEVCSYRVAVSPDGQYAVSGGLDKVIRFWELSRPGE